MMAGGLFNSLRGWRKEDQINISDGGSVWNKISIFYNVVLWEYLNENCLVGEVDRGDDDGLLHHEGQHKGRHHSHTRDAEPKHTDN